MTAAPLFFAVKNFAKFQHYRDRSPPWIKLYGEMLEDYEFAALPDATKGQLMSIWVLASRMANKLPWDPQFIGAKINANQPVDLAAMEAAGFIVPYNHEAALGKREDWPSRYVPDEVRAAVFERDGHKCRRCPATERLELDHIKPVSQGGGATEDNLQVLCVSCNRKKRAEQLRSNANADTAPVRSAETETETEQSRAPSAAAIPPPQGALPNEADLKTMLFGDCRSWLAGLNGGDPDKYRGKIGQWIRDHGAARVLDAFHAAQRAPPQGDAVAYLERILRGPPSGDRNGKQSDQQVTMGSAMARVLADARARTQDRDQGNDAEPVPDRPRPRAPG